jgi:hypothetical protein
MKSYYDESQPMQLGIGRQGEGMKGNGWRLIPPNIVRATELPDDRYTTVRARIWLDRGTVPYLSWIDGPPKGTRGQFISTKLYKYDSSVPKIEKQVWANLALRAEPRRDLAVRDPLAVAALARQIQHAVARGEREFVADAGDALEVAAQRRIAERERLGDAAFYIVDLVDDRLLVVVPEQATLVVGGETGELAQGGWQLPLHGARRRKAHAADAERFRVCLGAANQHDRVQQREREGQPTDGHLRPDDRDW